MGHTGACFRSWGNTPCINDRFARWVISFHAWPLFHTHYLMANAHCIPMILDKMDLLIHLDSSLAYCSIFGAHTLWRGLCYILYEEDCGLFTQTRPDIKLSPYYCDGLNVCLEKTCASTAFLYDVFDTDIYQYQKVYVFDMYIYICDDRTNCAHAWCFMVFWCGQTMSNFIHTHHWQLKEYSC